MKKNLLLAIFLLPAFLYAQEVLKSAEEEYYDFLSLQGLVERPTLGYRTLSDSEWNLSEDTEHLWKNNNLGSTKILWEPENPKINNFTKGFYQGFKYKIYGPEWFNSYNTASPYGQNDGALWQGKGYNTSLSSGIRAEGYGFELTFKPVITWSQNRDFYINTDIYHNQYSYSFFADTFTHYIDNVQRYGDSPVFNFNFGDSEARWNWHTLTVGFGTQSPWLGPAYLNPMLGSNNADPYPKLDAGLRKTKVIIPGVNWYIGDIEGRIWNGMLNESDYFGFKPETGKRMINAMSASYSPSFIPGFTFGLNRIIMSDWRPQNFINILRLFTTNTANGTYTGNDEDQKISIFIDWKFEKIGFEVYGEFGKDDFSANKITNPFHTAIYTVGAKQIIPLPKNLKSELIFEWNNFEMSQDFQLQWSYLGYYAHGSLSQGYTNNGQIIGAGSGAFGNSQYLAYKVYHNKGFVNLFFHRYCPNNNSIYSMAINNQVGPETDVLNKWYINYETYNCIGLECLYYFTDSFSALTTYNLVIMSNRNYERISILKSKNTFNNYFSIFFKYSL